MLYEVITAVIQIANWKIRRTQKKEKLVQYAERVWDIREGDDNARIDLAIEKTERFFHSLGMATRLSNYNIGADIVDKVVAGLEKHGMTRLSEHRNVTLDSYNFV